jgi:hypothetical protein
MNRTLGTTALSAVLALLLLTGCQPPRTVATATATAVPASSIAEETSKAVTPAKAASVAPTAVESDGWVLVGQALKAEAFTGSWSGSIRLRNTADHDRSGFVRLTILPAAGDDPLAVLSGAMNHIAAGATGTVMLVSTDKYAKIKGQRLALDVTSI